MNIMKYSFCIFYEKIPVISIIQEEDDIRALCRLWYMEDMMDVKRNQLLLERRVLERGIKNGNN